MTLGTGLSVSLCMWPLSLEAQGDVEPVTDYYATYNFLLDAQYDWQRGGLSYLFRPGRL